MTLEMDKIQQKNEICSNQVIHQFKLFFLPSQSSKNAQQLTIIQYLDNKIQMIQNFLQDLSIKCDFNIEQLIADEEQKEALNLCKNCFNKTLNGYELMMLDVEGTKIYRVHRQKQTDREGCEVIKQLIKIKTEELESLFSMWKILQQKLNVLPCGLNISEKMLEFSEEHKYNFNTFQQNQMEKLNKIIKSFQIIAIKQPEPATFFEDSPLKLSNEKIELSPEFKLNEGDDKLLITSSCIYIQNNKQNKQRQCKSPPVKPFLKHFKSPRKSMVRKTQIDQLKLARDLQAIKKDALKFKIYRFLAQQNDVPMTLMLIMTFRVYDALKSTQKYDKCMQLVLFNIQDLNLKCYLNMLEWKDVEVFKLVKVGLTDEQMPALLGFLADKSVESLVITSNKLTENSCKDFLHFNVPSLKSIYLGKNKILRFRVKQELKELQDKYNLYL